MKFTHLAASAAVISLLAVSCCDSPAGKAWKLTRVIEVEGRQGVACDADHYYISSSTALYKYTIDGELVASNASPFTELALPANHFGDIDVYENRIYTGIETFMDGVGQNIQVAVYDAQSLQYMYSIPWVSESGQVEVCGLAVDREHGRVWMADWVQGQEVYCYSIESGEYLGKVQLRPAPRLQQGIYIKDGKLYISCDDGDAEQGVADNLYVCDLYSPSAPQIEGVPSGCVAAADVRLFRTMSDFTRVGEIEGLSFNPASGNLLVVANRGARIIKGMPRGFYEGYDREIHELFVYEEQ